MSKLLKFMIWLIGVIANAAFMDAVSPPTVFNVLWSIAFSGLLTFAIIFD